MEEACIMELMFCSDSAASLMKLTDKECMRWPGGTCYGLVVDDDDSNPVEVEIAEDWVNRVEIVE